MALEDDGEHRAVVGGDGEVAALVELGSREARPVAVDAAAANLAAQNPDDVAVTVVGAGVAVLVHRAAEFGEDDDDRIVPIRAEPSGDCGEPVAEGPQMVGELALLVDVGVPAAKAGEGEANMRVAADQPGEPRCL